MIIYIVKFNINIIDVVGNTTYVPFVWENNFVV